MHTPHLPYKLEFEFNTHENRTQGYQLLDCGNGEKLEQFGAICLIRPALQALWQPRFGKDVWAQAHARFSREKNRGWEVFKPIPEQWDLNLHELQFKLKRTDFGHLGVFPEHASLWPWMRRFSLKNKKILNLFAYSGAATLALAAAGAQVTHVDAAHGMVQWARENAQINHLEKAPIRWLVDDVRKYLSRALRRNERYDAILLDPPSFGRGKVGEVFKIERDLPLLLAQCHKILSDDPLFVLLTCHTSGYTPLIMQQMMQEVFKSGATEAGEVFLEEAPISDRSQPQRTDLFKLPCGTFARWTP